FATAPLARAREAIRHEHEQKIEDSDYAAAVQMRVEALFPPPHPYGRAGSGRHGDIDAIAPEDARAFYAKWYRPSNATLVLVGDFAIADARALVHRYFADLPSLPVPERLAATALALPPLPAPQTLRVPEKLAPRPLVSLGWRTPPFFTVD